MGMFDYVDCKYPLPDPEAQNIKFQTKDLDCFMDHYEITEAGRLIHHKWEWESTPKEERRYPDAPEGSMLSMAGSIRHKADSYEKVDLDFHGILRFYGSKNTGELIVINMKTMQDDAHPEPVEWFEYKAKFTDGTLVRIDRLKSDNDNP